MKIKCRKCGTVLAERNYSKCLCDNCKFNKSDFIHSIINCILTISIILLIAFSFFSIHKYNKTHPITSETYLAKISDKEKHSQVVPIGIGVMSVPRYYIYYHNNSNKINRISVSPYVYYDYNIGDLITIKYEYRNGNIISTRYCN